MFRTSNQSFYNTKDDEKFPLITALNFAHLDEKEAEPVTPLICENCGSILTNREDMHKSGGNYEIQCEFCLHKNVIPADSVNITIESRTSDEKVLAFLLQQIRDPGKDALDRMQMDRATRGFPYQVAIIDVSGSMAGGKIESVKHALVQNVHQIAADFPKTHFILITFDSNVVIHMTPENEIKIEDGPAFFKESQMGDIITNITQNSETLEIEKVYKQWDTKIKKIRSLSMTALGPALFMGTQLIISHNLRTKSQAGGKILLLTDGLANVGLGSIETDHSPDSKHRAFYSRVAQMCLEHNLVVDMVAVRDTGGGNSVALDVIGKVTDYTGGSMLFITPDQIESAFAGMHRTSYVAQNVILRYYSPSPDIVLDEIQGTEVLQDISKANSGDPIHLGAFYPDRELYLKFKPKKNLKTGEKIPIQIQLEYLDVNRQKQFRVFRKNYRVVSEEQEFAKSYDPKVATAFELAKASSMKSKGNYNMAKAQAASTMNRNVTMSAQFGYEMGDLNKLVLDEMDEWEAEEAAAEDAQIADKSSYYAMMGQSRKRASFDIKMKRMKEKKK